MSDFSFLNNIELSEVAPKQMGRAKRAESNPVDADLRVFATGEIYPSLALVKEFNLEYQPEGSDNVENGFDLIDTKLWGMLPEGTPRFLAIATVSKNSARKPMLFGKSRKVDGKPVHSVTEQGSMASGNTVIEYLKTVLGIEMEGSYIDLNIVREHKIQSSNGIYNLPYVQQKGEDAGAVKTVRRENCEIYPLMVVESTEVPTEESPVENEADLSVEN